LYTQQFRNSEGKKAADYLKNRGISGETARDFMLGYSPVQWRDLLKPFEQQQLIDCGLLGRSDNGETYARFRGRLMFPIRDKRGRIIGFGGRVLDDSQPKYLNSPETALFNKGKEVYGLYELLGKNSKPQRILIVEGYMDVIALAQFGMHYAVAVLGTAASKTHLDLLFRYSSELVFCFDGDSAGQTAAWRLIEAAFASLKDGKSCRIMTLPAQHDPDSLIREQGLNAFTEQVETATPLSDYFFRHFETSLDLSSTEGRAQLVSQAKPHLDKLPDGIFKDMMFERLNKMSEFNARDSETLVAISRTTRQKTDTSKITPQRRALALLIQKPELINLLEERDINWNALKFEGAEKFNSILQVLLHERPVNTGALLEYYRGHSDELIIKRLEALELGVQGDIAADFSGTLTQLIKQVNKARRQYLIDNWANLSAQDRAELPSLQQLK
jgi:DNA primase